MTITQQPREWTAIRDLLQLEGKVAVVTGGAKGIGRGIVDRFAEAGAAVVIADLAREAAERVAQEVRASGGRVTGLGCDVSQEAQIVRFMVDAEKARGPLDILVNNAGIYPFRPVLEMTTAEWDHVQAVNLRGAFIFAREFAKAAIKRGEGGVIINIGSIDSLHPSMPGLAAYDASKGGMLMLTRSLALELGPKGVRVNLIAPGGIATEGSTAGLSGMTAGQVTAIQHDFVSKIPLGRMGDPDDIARVALFLASPAAAYMTGSTVVVDGGRLLG
ncbi:MAG: dehydrogenase [Dehalococcoidia bacterium]|nr:dehydrogenase [Dehalococcoidia bacterium]